MRTSMVYLSAAIVLGSASVPANACNARGEFCEYPTWAANAFATEGGENPRYSTNESYFLPDATAYGYVAGYGYAPASAYTYGRPAYGYAGPMDPEAYYRRRNRR